MLYTIHAAYTYLDLGSSLHIRGCNSIRTFQCGGGGRPASDEVLFFLFPARSSFFPPDRMVLVVNKVCAQGSGQGGGRRLTALPNGRTFKFRNAEITRGTSGLPPVASRLPNAQESDMEMNRPRFPSPRRHITEWAAQGDDVTRAIRPSISISRP